MTTITAAMVKELRERTGSGMMECKKALGETNGDLDAAIELMRKSGQAKAAKKAGRTAAEGVIELRFDASGKQAVMVEINCETDFVAKDANFLGFVDGVTTLILGSTVADVETLMGETLPSGESVTAARDALVAKIGENINVRRFERFESAATLAGYLHGVRIGVVVELEGGNADLARDVAMHVAATNPVCISAEQVPADLLAKEKEIYMAKAAESGKPIAIVEKMVEGQVRKYLAEVTLVGQPFVKDPDQTVEKLLAANQAKVLRFKRFEVGEGIEKKKEDFAAEVRAQAGL